MLRYVLYHCALLRLVLYCCPQCLCADQLYVTKCLVLLYIMVSCIGRFEPVIYRIETCLELCCHFLLKFKCHMHITLHCFCRKSVPIAFLDVMEYVMDACSCWRQCWATNGYSTSYFILIDGSCTFWNLDKFERNLFRWHYITVGFGRQLLCNRGCYE